MKKIAIISMRIVLAVVLALPIMLFLIANSLRRFAVFLAFKVNPPQGPCGHGGYRGTRRKRYNSHSRKR